MSPDFLDGKVNYVSLQYVPREPKKAAALNFHLTIKEKEDLYKSIYDKVNLDAVDTLMKLMAPPAAAPDSATIR